MKTTLLRSFVYICAMCWAQFSFSQNNPQNIQSRNIQFDTDWCPRPEEIVEIQKYMSLWRNGCCIQSAMLNYEAVENPQLIDKWRNRIVEKNNFGLQCTGKVLSVEDQQTKDQVNRQAAIAAKEKQRLEVIEAEAALTAIEADLKAKIAARRTNAPNYLRTFTSADLCEAIGTAIRDSTVDSIGTYPELSRIVITEARRRGYSFSIDNVKSQKVRIGMTECELYASLGLPDKQNRTVSTSGIHIQHVYSTPQAYFYTTNGRLTSWQD